jgi:hypothetical protein
LIELGEQCCEHWQLADRTWNAARKLVVAD